MARLGQTAARGVAVTVIGQGFRFLLQLASLAVLSRLLVPGDYGKLAMVTAIIGIASVLGDLGLSFAAIQARSLTDGQRSNLFWINATIGLSLALFIILLSGTLGWFYNDPDVPMIAVALSTAFVLNGLTAQFKAEVTRRMGFAWLAFTDVSAQALGLVSGVIVAIVGAGYWALVVQQVGIALATLLLTVLGSPWRPGLPRRREKMRSLLRFGTATTATQLINYASVNIDSIVIGRMWGAADLGIYNRVFQLFSLPLQQIAAPVTRVALSILSSIEGSLRYLAFVQRAQKVLAYALLPGLAMMAVAARPLLGTLLGNQWTRGAPILAVLVVGGVFQGLGYVYYWIFLSLNRMTILLVCEFAGRALMIAAILIAAPYGVLWVAVAVSGGLFAVWCIVGLFGLPRVGFRASQLLGPTVTPFILSVAVYFANQVIMLAQRNTDVQPWLQLMLVGLVSLCVMVFGAIVPAVRRDYRQLLNTFMLIRRQEVPQGMGTKIVVD